MPKFAHHEAAVHHFLLAAKRVAEVERLYRPYAYEDLKKWILSLTFDRRDSHTVRVLWKYPKSGESTFSIQQISYYVRGDTKESALVQKRQGLVFSDDAILTRNDQLFYSFVRRIAKKAGFTFHPKNKPTISHGTRSMKSYDGEEHLSDDWAQSIDVSSIDVRLMNESPTAPEMKYIVNALGDIRGKRIVDVGCGLGEAAIYFALKGARVTTVDLSPEMLMVVRKLAKRYHVRVRTVLASVEHLPFRKNETFDIFYAGNLFHHVDIPVSMKSILAHMHERSVLACWEPVRYNPVINIYRNIAVRVRSFGERPLGVSEIHTIRGYFKQSRVEWFWLTSLLMFVYMYVVERRDPNKERYWKSVVKEGPKRAWGYRPLAWIDRLLLLVFPVLKPLCWNVVMVMKKPVKRRRYS